MPKLTMRKVLEKPSAGFVPAARVAQEGGVHPRDFGAQLKKGAWPGIRWQRVKGPKGRSLIFVNKQDSAEAIEFYKKHASIESVSRMLGEHTTTMGRDLDFLESLPPEHGILRSIGGRVRRIRRGKYAYLPLAQIARFERFLANFFTPNEAEKELQRRGLGRKELTIKLFDGHWPAALFFRGKRRSIVHRGVVDLAQEFFESHYTHGEAFQKAGVSQSTLHNWVVKWKFPTVELGRHQPYYPHRGFDELVAEFKKGRRNAIAAARKWREGERKFEELRGPAGTMEEKQLPAAIEGEAIQKLLVVLNSHCLTKAQQEQVLNTVRKLIQEGRQGEGAEAARHYAALLADSTGLHTEFAKTLQSYAEMPNAIEGKLAGLRIFAQKKPAYRLKLLQELEATAKRTTRTSRHQEGKAGTPVKVHH